MLSNKKLNSLILVCSFLLPIAIFCITAWQTHGWDDEFAAIRYVEQNSSFTDLVNFTNNNDPHPMGMYILDSFFYKIFNNWSIVRVVGALLTALSLWIFWVKTRKDDDFTADFLYYILICLNPSVLLWCSGLRWYTWILPFVCFLGLLMNKSSENFSRTGTIKFWCIYFILSVLMFYISYFAVIIISISFILICYERRKFLISELKLIVPLGLLSIILISYQAYCLLTVQFFIGKDLMTQSIIKYIAYAGQYFLSGAALTPVSVFGIVSAAAGVILFISFLINLRTISKNFYAKFWILSVVMNIFLKMAMFARYYVLLTPQHSAVIRDSFSLIKNKKLKVFVLIACCISTAGGIYAVMAHRNTIKASWNTPYAEIINRISSINETKNIPVATSNTVLEWYLKKDGFNIINFLYDNNSFDVFSRPMIIVKTFRGTLSTERYQELNNFIENHSVKAKFEIGYDDYAWFKRKFDSDYPDYYAEIFLIE